MAKFFSARCDECGWFPEKYEDVEECREDAREHAEDCAGKENMTIRAWG